MATHSGILAWRIPGTEEPGGLPSTGLQSQTRLKRLSRSSSRNLHTIFHSGCTVYVPTNSVANLASTELSNNNPFLFILSATSSVKMLFFYMIYCYFL